MKCWIPGCDVVDTTRMVSSIVKWGANNSSIECSRCPSSLSESRSLQILPAIIAGLERTIGMYNLRRDIKAKE